LALHFQLRPTRHANFIGNSLKIFAAGFRTVEDGLEELFEPGDTLDIGQWVSADAPIQGVVFEDAFCAELQGEHCGLLRCIGVTRPELEFAMKHGTPALIARLDRAHVYPHTMIHRRESIELAT
jgi:hypothetical protein